MSEQRNEYGRFLQGKALPDTDTFADPKGEILEPPYLVPCVT